MQIFKKKNFFKSKKSKLFLANFQNYSFDHKNLIKKSPQKIDKNIFLVKIYKNYFIF